ncbi:MAG: DNA polymerase I, partial [Aestuariivirgaceae bacterium]|nr:DNA polymerase I [Aestuariivirgaceae bacterium]
LNKLLRETNAGHRPTHLAVIFDKSSVTFRNALYSAYKANRAETPADLIPQFALIRHATRAFNVPCIEQEGYEADDLIATYAEQAVAAGASVRIVSSDKDLMQLIGRGISLYDTMKDKEIGPAEVLEKFGVPPEKVIDVQALAGDSVDNVPGVPGIGVKTGAQLITEYGDLETLLARASEIKQPKRRESLIEFAEQARISKTLVTLMKDVPVDTPLDQFGVANPNAKQLIGFLKAMEFTALTRRIASEIDADANEIEPVLVDVTHWTAPAPIVAEAAAVEAGVAPAAASSGSMAYTPQARAQDAAARLANVPFPRETYECVTTMERLEHWIARAYQQGHVAVDTETNSLDTMRADLVGVCLAVAPGEACYIPLAHRSGDGLDFGGAIAQVPFAQAIAALKPLLEDPSITKVGHNFKYDLSVLHHHGIDVWPLDCTMLMSYALDSGLNGHGMDELSEKHFGHKPIAYKEVTGTGKNAVTFDLVPLDRATPYAAEDADITLRLWMLLSPRLVADARMTVYQTLERPLMPVLSRMEREGILVDRQLLARFSGEFAVTLARIEGEIHEMAGEKFNIGSPKQLGDILFGRMGLQGGRKTATGAWSTDSDTLDELALQGVPLAQKVLDWRSIAKLKSTYTDALPTFIHPRTGRVHTSYSMASTSTGRLSSTEPNLQNIPVRTEEGRKIRTAFIAPKGMKLISADYSQIELRVLAHVADIPQLKKAFAKGLDIHAMTASEMFSTPIEGMDPQVRRRAKAINFGIIYGISAFGLANQLGIGREEAGEYIRTYFKRFPGIRDYMDATKKLAKEQGYVETMFGRRCHFPRITSSNPSERAFMERAAINAPIQGSAADVIRRAMIRMLPALEQAGLSTRMLLQVHDELVFEAPEAQAEQTMLVARRVMEHAAEPLVQFSVPIQVDARAADNWEAAH